MSKVLILEFETPKGLELYQSVNRILGLDSKTGAGEWPAPLEAHIAGSSDNGLVVAEIWDSMEGQEAFMAQLGAAFQEANVPPPSRAEWFDLAGSHHRH